MKVLWLFSHPAPYKIDFFNSLGQKIDLHVIFERNQEGDRPKEFYYEKAKNFKMEILPSIKLGDSSSYYGPILKKIKSIPFDIIVINGYATFTEMKVIRYLNRHKIPYIIAINGGIPKRNEPFLKKKLKTHYLSKAKMYFCPDVHSKDYLLYYGAKEKDIRLYPYSTVFEKDIPEEALTAEEKSYLRVKSGLSKDKLFVSATSLSERKNVIELIRLFEKAPKEYRLIILGSGSLEKECREYISKHHLHNVEIYPFSSHKDVLGYFRMADYSLLWTKEDIYGHVVNESLSQGTPVISSINSNAAKNLIENGDDGYLLSLSDEAGFLEALNKEYTPEIGEKCLRKARENTIEQMVDVHIKHLEEFLK